MNILDGASISITYDESMKKWIAGVRDGDKMLLALDDKPELAIGRACIMLSFASDEELKAIQERIIQESAQAAKQSSQA